MKILKPLCLTLIASLATLLSVSCMSVSTSSTPTVPAPTILVSANRGVVMDALKKECTAVYANCKLTQIDENRLQAISTRNPNGISDGQTLFTLTPKSEGVTEISVSIIVITATTSAMQIPWYQQTKEMFLRTGILDRTKAAAEASPRA